MGIYYETLLTDALNDQNFDYIYDLDEVELFLTDYLEQRGGSLIGIKIIEITGKPRRLKIEYNYSNGPSLTYITINKWD